MEGVGWSLHKGDGSAGFATDLDEMHGLLDIRSGELDGKECWLNDRSCWSCATSSSISIRRLVSRKSCCSASFRAITSAASALCKPDEAGRLSNAGIDSHQRRSGKQSMR